MTDAIAAELSSGEKDSRALRRRWWRTLKDRSMGVVMAVGGVGVILAILLIFFYLVFVVLPLFRAASVEPISSYRISADDRGRTLRMATEEYAEIGMQLTNKALVRYFNLADGTLIAEYQLPGVTVDMPSANAAGDPAGGLFALGMTDGRAVVFKNTYRVTYPNDVRKITPAVAFPLGEAPIVVDEQGAALLDLEVQGDEERTTVVALTTDRRLIAARYTVSRSLLDEDDITVAIERAELQLDVESVSHLVLSPNQESLYVATRDGSISFYSLIDVTVPRLVDRVRAVSSPVRISAVENLVGGISLLVGDSSGSVTQWFPVRDESNEYSLARVRTFADQHAPITSIASEYFRKGFAAVDETGTLGVYHTTAHRTLLVTDVSEGPLQLVNIAPRADTILMLDTQDQLRVWAIDNEHPEVSWNSLWGKVWYESRQSAEYIWQSSSASSDFEPKFSLTPLAFGTIKASIYAMLFAIPLSILGAVYTAYFMSPRMRRYVKPTIEIMAALPTVILGFLAGLWLAPLIESNLPGVFCVLLFVPVAILFAAYVWHWLPGNVRHAVPDGFEAALLVPVVIAAVYVAVALGEPIEANFFAGDMPAWLTSELGIPFDQRNSLVVGLAMGFAVIPTIFSISEDAVFEVPRHLTVGSLALGATPWQTMVRVVLLTASPGIFSGVMIGLGRAVGETMIVLMATGNTPLVDFNIFQGFRALSANIAVEMPESEVASTHYRILFLAALVLFLATFLFNTLAELVRHRLRNKYSSL